MSNKLFTPARTYLAHSKHYAQTGHILRLLSPVRAAVVLLEIGYLLIQMVIIGLFKPVRLILLI